MFVLRKQSTCWWPVKVKWPDPKVAGREVTHEFEIEVRLIDQDEIEAQDAARNAIIEQAGRDVAEGAIGEAEAAEQSKTLVQKLDDYAKQTFVDVITNWRNVRDEAGDEVPFTDTLLRQALGQPRTRAAIQAAVNEAIHGGARVKN